MCGHVECSYASKHHFFHMTHYGNCTTPRHFPLIYHELIYHELLHIFNIGSFSRTTFAWLWIYVANAAMEGLNKALKICQRSCTIYRKLRFVRTKSALFKRSLPHLWKQHSNSRFPICSKAVLQTHVRKVF